MRQLLLEWYHSHQFRKFLFSSFHFVSFPSLYHCLCVTSHLFDVCIVLCGSGISIEITLWQIRQYLLAICVHCTQRKREEEKKKWRKHSRRAKHQILYISNNSIDFSNSPVVVQTNFIEWNKYVQNEMPTAVSVADAAAAADIFIAAGIGTAENWVKYKWKSIFLSFFLGQALLVIAGSDSTLSQLQHKTIGAHWSATKEKGESHWTEKNKLKWNVSSSGSTEPRK